MRCKSGSKLEMERRQAVAPIEQFRLRYFQYNSMGKNVNLV